MQEPPVLASLDAPIEAQPDTQSAAAPALDPPAEEATPAVTVAEPPTEDAPAYPSIEDDLEAAQQEHERRGDEHDSAKAAAADAGEPSTAAPAKPGADTGASTAAAKPDVASTEKIAEHVVKVIFPEPLVVAFDSQAIPVAADGPASAADDAQQFASDASPAVPLRQKKAKKRMWVDEPVGPDEQTVESWPPEAGEAWDAEGWDEPTPEAESWDEQAPAAESWDEPVPAAEEWPEPAADDEALCAVASAVAGEDSDASVAAASLHTFSAHEDENADEDEEETDADASDEGSSWST